MVSNFEQANREGCFISHEMDSMSDDGRNILLAAYFLETMSLSLSKEKQIAEL